MQYVFLRKRESNAAHWKSLNKMNVPSGYMNELVFKKQKSFIALKESLPAKALEQKSVRLT